MSFFSTKLVATFGFYTGGKIAKALSLSHHSSTFVEELIMLAQFEIGTGVASKLLKSLRRKRGASIASAMQKAIEAKEPFLKENPSATKEQQFASC